MSDLQASFAEEAQQQRAELEAAVADHAERARTGELGPEQRRLQERVDNGETTWGAVLTGADGSLEAVEARAAVDQGAADYDAALDAQLEIDRLAGRPDPRADAVDALAILRAAAAEAFAEHGEMRPDGQ